MYLLQIWFVSIFKQKPLMPHTGTSNLTMWWSTRKTFQFWWTLVQWVPPGSTSMESLRLGLSRWVLGMGSSRMKCWWLARAAGITPYPLRCIPCHISHILDLRICLQDLAAERCSMPYRAPELFQVDSYCKIDERIDIWVSWNPGLINYFVLHS